MGDAGCPATKVSLALQKSPRAAHIPRVPRNGEDAAAVAQRYSTRQPTGRNVRDFHPTDPSLGAGVGPAVVGAGEELQHPCVPATALPTSSRSHPYPHQQQPELIPLQGAGAGGWATAPLLSCSRLRGTMVVLSGRVNTVLGTSSRLQDKLDPLQQLLPSFGRPVPALSG